MEVYRYVYRGLVVDGFLVRLIVGFVRGYGVVFRRLLGLVWGGVRVFE